MISDEILSAAAGEVAAAMAASAPDCGHVFSRGFERKMEHLIRRAAHPVRHRVLRYAAAIVLAAVTAFGSLYLLSPTVRAVVKSWIKTTYGSYIQYYSENTTPPELEYDYFLPEEFDGYTLSSKKTIETQFFSIYTNDLGQMLSFSYVHGSGNTSMFLMDIENHTYYSGAVGPFSADIYISPYGEDASVIVWHDPDDNVLFCISAFASKDELITFAEKMQKTEKITN